ncbi:MULTISPECIES: O-antigen ligase family protein [Heyndrickxia]|uniref:O-antigen ligase family protein n=1 Tax=Heyndrickxia TaxID=2837504 RepID=UPI0008F8B906|nr:O-antigen ligase family protein [Heyndrickxia coagulans]APB38211.1 hypothetical protein BIZ35_16540 [Heyndrickxia coagulans]MDT9754956.1 O-antigen ligase family protein [Heyndrickxia coagulans]QPG53944.1 O-antigen ligase family protein [Heyndrickxia coagulans]WNE62022.1 O-antigen ligase family protein [Heyndrickxia coagulans]
MIYLYYIFIILVGAISWKPLIPEHGGLVLTSVKACLLVITIILILIRGIKVNFIMIYSIFGMCVLTLFLILQIARKDSVEYANTGDILRSYSAYLLLLLSMLVRLKKEELLNILKIIQVMPSISVIVGLIFSITTSWSFIKFEFTGVPRLQGSNPPAHLAEICFVAIITSLAILDFYHINKVILDRGKRAKLYIFLFINSLIILLTFTRIEILGVIIIFIFFLIRKLYYAFLKDNFSYLLVSILSLGIIPLLFCLKIIIQLLIKRSTNNSGGFNTSGRAAAWKYFMEKANEHRFFGRGMGASESLYPYNPYQEFVAPHNEYIRSFLEVGVVGLIIMFIFFLVYIKWILKQSFKKNVISNIFVICTIISISIVSYYDNLFVTVHFSIPFILANLCFINYVRLKCHFEDSD